MKSTSRSLKVLKKTEKGLLTDCFVGEENG
jgi:hypothetical protein